ncbi:7568_t:CDS:2 [Entrophospora sp. SA101]|nr:11016_t:CDS:2 [Entrophospora sp. SA101]CAJ0631735.1 7568_t:CDS:2 [Entrophospora sp. SA101]CAJ0825812.1 9335_t:CDS:2 [Entrophospora sp. SA101]
MLVVGSRFFDSVTKEQFFIKGVAYQPNRNIKGGNFDPLANVKHCKRDIDMMKELGINVIRVYQIDNHENHDECMNYLEQSGIYLILDLATSYVNVNRDSPEWSLSIYKNFITTALEFSKYKNTLGFFAGNEVSNVIENTDASVFVKAAIRDVKKFLKKYSSRYIPVGYSSNDDANIRIPLLKYFNCGDDENARADFYGVNMYEWCGKNSYETSGYAERTKEFSGYSIPVFLSEYGCNTYHPRLFEEVSTIYENKEMISIWSGGIVYEWTQETNNYGLIEYDSNGNSIKLPDYENLKKKLSLVNIPRTDQMDSYQPKNSKHFQCPEINENWKATNRLPPTPSIKKCKCMKSRLESCQFKGAAELVSPINNNNNSLDCSSIDNDDGGDLLLHLHI